MTGTYLARPEEVVRLQAAGYRPVCEAQGGRTLMSLSPAAAAQNAERAALTQELEAARREAEHLRGEVTVLRGQLAVLRQRLGVTDAGPPLLPGPAVLPRILQLVAATWHVPEEMIRAPARRGPVLDADGRANLARSAYYLLAREETACSLKQIGRELGGRDHSTVAKVAREAQRRAASDLDYRARLASLRAQLRLDRSAALPVVDNKLNGG